ncbi:MULTISPECIES: hypothetical protein [Spiroplasma]|uniref:hypothetical protein n=1 Tax=Spiroplasma TaxID=2132 RepID=UPI0018DC43FE|nr:MULTISPECIES: hypothetical protein [Spiroplasma]MBH8623425.1 hypothetical protein [Spiroplasma sp. hyd1]UNF61156.1 hypothetical protein MNU24_04360 [Spiroplasma poulsonii]
MTWNQFLDKVYQGLYQFAFFIPANKLGLVDKTVEYYVCMVVIWLFIFFTIWFVIYMVSKICKVVF